MMTTTTRAFLLLGTIALTACSQGSAQTDDEADGTPVQTDDALSAGGEGSQPPNAPPVYFNHQYAMIPKATTDAMATNRYLNDVFVDVEVRTTVRPDSTYTGTYFNTRETYLEFFPEGTFGYPVGVAALALGVEKEGGIESMYSRWSAEFTAPRVEAPYLISHEVKGVTVPWFNLTQPKWSYWSTYNAVWGMEYVPNPNSTVPRTRHEERSARYDSTKLAQNVQAVIFGLADTDLPKMRRSLAAVGWTVRPQGDGFIALSPMDHGTRRAYVGQKATPGRLGLLGIVWTLNRRAMHTERVGSATLQVGLLGLPLASMWFVTPSAADDATAASAAAAGN